MKKIRYLFILFAFIFVSCASVPKEAVELSATVGRDMAEMQKAHVALVNLYYDRLLRDINKFVDDVYVPFQIQATLNDNALKSDLLEAIETASLLDSTGIKQKSGIAKIEAFIQIIHEKVELYRQDKIKPIENQKAVVLKNIEESYERIHYANSIVTGHLASVVKVHETQNEILAKLDLENLREKVSVKTADLSDNVAELLEAAKEKDAQLSKVVKKFEELLKKAKK